MPVYAQDSRECLANELEIFESATARSRGLLKFDQAPERYAAVFVMPYFGFLPIIHTFGMKFPIDIAFLSRDRRILKFFRGVSAGRLVAPLKHLWGGCKYVVEFSQCDTSRLQEGERLEWGSRP